MVFLIKPNTNLEMKFREMMLDYKNFGDDTFNNDYFNCNFNFSQYILDIENLSMGIGLPDGYVPTSEWWLINEVNDIIGTVRLRHYLGYKNIQDGGHIGYDINPKYRNLGYGNKLLELVLKEAPKYGLTKVLLTCHKHNIPSKKIIEKNGGTVENIHEKIENSTELLRYWINL